MIKRTHPLGFEFDFSAYVWDVCRPGAGADTCRYLVGDIIGGAGLHCAKFQPQLAARLDARVAAGTFIARGDNCPGRPYGDVL